MKGDFSRDTFLHLNHDARVLHQQGRVQLDADVNEQTSILLHLLRRFGADLIGAHGGPRSGLGFEVIHKALGAIDPPDLALKNALEQALATSLVIAPGHYYIDGLLIENEEFFLLNKDNRAVPIEASGQVVGSLQSQPNHRVKSDEEGNHLENIINAREPEKCIIYLDAWEHHVTHLENDHIREVALGGPDTATRAQVVWQVRVEAAGNFAPDEPAGEPKNFSP